MNKIKKENLLYRKAIPCSRLFLRKEKTREQAKEVLMLSDSYKSEEDIERELDFIYSARECNLNSVWFLFLLNHNKYNFFFLDLQMLLKVVFGCVQGRRRMSRLYTLAHIRELPFLCV